MKYKLVASDIDGTLLNDKNEITPAVRQAIEAAQEHGTIFTLSTGRSLKGIGLYLELLKDDSPVIICNGAIIIKASSAEVIFKAEMPRSAADIIIEKGVDEGAVVAVWTDGLLYSTDTHSSYSEFYKALSNIETLPVSELPDSDVTKIVWLLPQDRVSFLQDNYVPPEGVQSRSSGPHYLEFFSVDAGKDKALRFLAEHLGINVSETIAIGDNYNDIDMLRAAGLGIAMENAPDEVKKAAGHITASNNEDGVARAIERFVLN